jgi:hypothetical protein
LWRFLRSFRLCLEVPANVYSTSFHCSLSKKQAMRISDWQFYLYCHMHLYFDLFSHQSNSISIFSILK